MERVSVNKPIPGLEERGQATRLVLADFLPKPIIPVTSEDCVMTTRHGAFRVRYVVA